MSGTNRLMRKTKKQLIEIINEKSRNLINLKKDISAAEAKAAEYKGMLARSEARWTDGVERSEYDRIVRELKKEIEVANSKTATSLSSDEMDFLELINKSIWNVCSFSEDISETMSGFISSRKKNNG